MSAMKSPSASVTALRKPSASSRSSYSPRVTVRRMRSTIWLASSSVIS